LKKSATREDTDIREKMLKERQREGWKEGMESD
jgi:hypothetical protein